MLRIVCFVIALSVLSAVSHAASPDFHTVEKILNASNAPRNVPGFLKQLKHQHPDFFKDFTLMRESQSLQGGSPAAPRAIVFGSDARFILTFNGEADQVGFQKIEMMQFVSSSKGGAFQLREIVFDSDGRKRPTLSQVNPPTCSRCHGTDPKPIWESYDRWPGAYGEDDDALIDFDEPSRYPPRYPSDDIANRHRKHLKEFRGFVATKDQHPRYQYLDFPKGTDSPVAPYIPGGRTGTYPLRPNLQLTKLIAELNGIKLQRKLAELPKSCNNMGAPILAALLLECENIKDLKPTFTNVLEDIIHENEKHPAPAALKPALWSAANGDKHRPYMVPFLNTMGFSDFDWSSARLKRQWLYFQGFKDGSDDFLAAIWPDLKERGYVLPGYQAVRANMYPSYYRDGYGGSYEKADPSIKEEDSYSTIDDDSSSRRRHVANAREASCIELTRDLATFSVTDFKTTCAPSADPLPTREVPPIVQTCLSCHNGSTDAPKLPLSSRNAPVSLKKLIWKRIHSTNQEERMPPERPLTAKEYHDLQQFYYPSRNHPRQIHAGYQI